MLTDKIPNWLRGFIEEYDGTIRFPKGTSPLSSSPSNPNEGWVYLDDGTNTESGNPAWRGYISSSWQDIGGTMTGPASSTDNAPVRWDGTGGDTLQDTPGITLDDSGNVHLDDDIKAYLGSDNDYSLTFDSANDQFEIYDEGASSVLLTIESDGTINVQGNSINKLLRAQLQEITTPSTPPSGYKELFTKSSGLAHVLDDAGNEIPLLGQAGDSTWKNRSYEGWEILNTDTTYTIGSSEDFTDYTEAANALQGLILNAELELVLQENIDVSSGALFKNILAISGNLRIDLNGHTYELTSGSPEYIMGFKIIGSVRFSSDSGAGGELKASTSNTFPLYRLIKVDNEYCSLTIAGNCTLDASGNSYKELVYDKFGQLLWQGPTVEGNGNLDKDVRLEYGAQGYADPDPSSITVGIGSIWVQDNGTVVGGA